MAKGLNSYIHKEDKKAIEEISYCQYCGSVENLCIDHFIPPSRGGDSKRDNLVRACGSCNSSKSDNLPEEWLKLVYKKQALAAIKLTRLTNTIKFLNNTINGRLD